MFTDRDQQASLCDLDMAPALQWREQHKQVCRAVALIFVIDTLRLSLFHRQRRPRLGDQLLGGLVQADERHLGIVRLGVDVQHFFHRRYECATCFRRDNPLLFTVRLQRVFLSARPIVLSLARSTMPSSTTLSSSKRSVQRARPSGGAEQASAVSRAVFRRQKSVLLQGARAVCGSAQPPGLLRRIGGAPAKP
jgi:hypothetical protein